MSGNRGAAPPDKRARGAHADGDRVAGRPNACVMIADVGALPDELVLHVFVHLDTKTLMTAVPGVCRRWRALYRDTPRVRVDLSFAPVPLLSAPPVRHQTRSAPTSSIGLTEALARFKHVESVVAPFACDGVACIIASSCPRVSAVDFTSHSDPDVVYNGITDVGVVALAEHCPLLKYVDFRQGSQSDASLVALADHCSRLTSLAVGGAFGVGFGGISIVGVRSIMEHRGPQLTAVCFNECANLNDEMVVAMAENCPRLILVSLRASRTTDAGLIALAQHCSGLRSVDLSYCQDIADDGVVVLAQRCSHLTDINVCGCAELTDVAVATLATRCRHMIRIDAGGCSLLTDGALRALGKYCPQLKVVWLMMCNLLTDAGVAALAEGCPFLTELEFTGCSLLADGALRAIAKYCTRIEVADFARCPLLTDAGVIDMAEHCTQLTKIVLRGCDRLTGASTVALETHCPRLFLIMW
jgi:F-box/leucine-rich repeat protein 2/20